MGILMDSVDIARLIDHTNLRPEATADDIVKLCGEAARHGFASACVASCWAALAREELDRCEAPRTRVCAVVGFPFGSASAAAKAAEAEAAVEAGAGEIDAVMNIGFLRSGMIDRVERDLSGIVKAGEAATVKVIIETCYLTDPQKVLASRLVKASGADFVKTSTGYGPSGARLEDVTLIKEKVPGLKIKASGGIRTLKQAWAFVRAGADRIGTSAGPAIVAEQRPGGED